MVAVFTPRKEIQQIAREKVRGVDFPSAGTRYFPDAQIKGPVLYEGRIRVTTAAGQVSFELLDGTYAAAGIIATDNIFVETEDLHVAGAWTVGTVSDPDAEVDPLDPPPVIEIVQIDPENTSGSHSTVEVNRTRGHVDTTVEGRISAAINFTTDNLRARGELGVSRSSDNLRQLTFEGAVSGRWDIGDTITGGTSGATGKIVGLGPRINTAPQDGVWLVVDMGVDYGGAEWDTATPDVVTASITGASGTLKTVDFAARSTGILFRQAGQFDAFVPAGAPGTLLGNMGGTPGAISTVSFNPGGVGANKVLFNPSWKIPAILGDYARFSGSLNGNDGIYGPIIGFENGGPGIDNVAIFADDFPNPDGSNQSVILELFSPLTEKTLITRDHTAEIPIAGDPQASVDLESPADSWNALGVFDNDTIEIVEASPAFTSGSAPFGLFRVHEIPVANRVTMFPTFSPSTQFDTGTITVYRRRPASE